MSAIRLAERLGLVAVLAIVLLVRGRRLRCGWTGIALLQRLRSDAASCPQPASPPSPTRTVLDGTLPLRVRLSAPPASFSPRPTLSPAVAGTWTTRGDSEIFTPASTLDPCANYTLTIPAASTAVAHSPLAKQRTVALSIQCPSVKGLQQTLARLGYLPYGAHSSIRARAVRGRSCRGASKRGPGEHKTSGRAPDDERRFESSGSHASEHCRLLGGAPGQARRGDRRVRPLA